MDVGSVKLFNSSECSTIVKNSIRSSSLEENGAAVVLRYRVERGAADLVGFMGEYYRLHVDVADESAEGGCRPLRYFVKSIPRTNECFKAECERKGFFKKETRIYTDILPRIQQYASTKLYAECYYTRPDVIVLEDLSALPCSFQQSASQEIYTLQHHHVVLEHLARLHTASIAWELREGVNIGEEFKDALMELQLTMTNEWYETGVKGILFLAKRNPKLKSPEVQNFIEFRLFDLLCQAEKLTLPSKKGQNVLCHRDTWDRNIFYQYDSRGAPIKCLLVDFQLTRYSSPTMDVNFFIHVTTTRQQRVELYEQLLDYYFEAFQTCCKELQLPANLLTQQAFRQDNKRARLAALILLGICEPLLKMPDGLASKMRAEEQERFDHYMNCERDELFLRVMAADPNYEPAIMAPVEELIAYLMENDELMQLDED